MKILAFGASNSQTSINKQLVTHAADIIRTDILPEADIDLIDLNDFEMPLFSIDREKADGIPQPAHDFLNKIKAADALLISFAEHNSSYTAAYKNLYDWASRIEAKVYQGKQAIVLSASPGGRGGASVMATVLNVAPYQGLNVKAHLSVGKFYDVFKKGALMDENLSKSLRDALSQLRHL